jgi:hypothetical protein
METDLPEIGSGDVLTRVLARPSARTLRPSSAAPLTSLR